MKRAFTMIELVVVMAILAVIAAVVFPVFGQAVSKARQTGCLSNVRQVYLAAQLYRQDEGEYPNLPGNLNHPAFRAYLGGSALVCPADPRPDDGFSYHIDGAMPPADLESPDPEVMKGYKARLECRDRRGPDLPAVTDRNHANKREGYRTGEAFFLVARESGAVVRVPRSHLDAMLNGRAPMPCDPLVPYLSL